LKNNLIPLPARLRRAGRGIFKGLRSLNPFLFIIMPENNLLPFQVHLELKFSLIFSQKNNIVVNIK